MSELVEILRAMLGKAQRKLEAAERAVEANDWEDAASRACYAAFHAVSADLRERGQVHSKHGQVIGAFNRDVVRAGNPPP